ncbi:hypothetical protein LCGC14_2219740, partial [marine sediment metagenome]
QPFLDYTRKALRKRFQAEANEWYGPGNTLNEVTSNKGVVPEDVHYDSNYGCICEEEG